MRVLRRVGRCGIAGLLALQLAGCGTLLYPERHGLRGGRVDPAVVLLDGALLLFYAIPGLVELGVDFDTGSVYLPDGHHGVRILQFDPRDLDEEYLEALLLTETGYPLELEDAVFMTLPMSCPEEALEPDSASCRDEAFEHALSAS